MIPVTPLAPLPARPRLRLVVALGLALVSPSALAQQQPEPASADPLRDDVRTYCSNIVDEARDQRYLLQAKELKDIGAGIDERIKVLEARRDDYREWLAKREEFLRVAESTLIDIYKNMKPDAAAAQLELVNPEIAAAIVMKLNARLASQILNEMDAKIAASLTGIIASAAATQPPKDPT